MRYGLLLDQRAHAPELRLSLSTALLDSTKTGASLGKLRLRGVSTALHFFAGSRVQQRGPSRHEDYDRGLIGLHWVTRF
jgi:hypothetical protein